MKNKNLYAAKWCKIANKAPIFSQLIKKISKKILINIKKAICIHKQKKIIKTMLFH